MRKGFLLGVVLLLGMTPGAGWGANPITDEVITLPGTVSTVGTPGGPVPAGAPAAAGVAPGTPAALSPVAAREARFRAEQDWKGLWDHLTSRVKILFYNGKPRFREWVGGPKATVWPHSQALAAGLDLAVLNGNLDVAKEALAGLERFSRGNSYNPSENHWPQARFYDDNAWIGLDFVQAWRVSGDRKWLDKARGILTFLKEGLHKDGGLYWKEKEARMSRNTASNGPALQLALAIYEATHERQYLDFARNLEKFMYGSLRSPDGLFWDNLGDDGTTEKTIWSYNQGTMLGADVQFYRLTGDRKYLARAKQTADAAVAFFGTDDRLWKQPPAFNAVFFRNLLKLEEFFPDAGYRKILADHLDRARREAYDEATGLYGGGGLGKYTGSEPKTEVIDQAAFVQMQSLLAMTPEQLRKVS
ncbi:MAG: hypothetical protein GX442_13340 [Candidatus Riflebacteria bacterium]|nr:hypothetical protein [Candidatus Riflebacteria bacterium]